MDIKGQLTRSVPDLRGQIARNLRDGERPGIAPRHQRAREDGPSRMRFQNGWAGTSQTWTPSRLMPPSNLKRTVPPVRGPLRLDDLSPRLRFRVPTDRGNRRLGMQQYPRSE